MPNMTSLYQTERTSRLARFQGYPVPPAEFTFEIRVETELRRVCTGGCYREHEMKGVNVPRLNDIAHTGC